MEIKVLGSCCSKCKTTYETIECVINECNLDATLVKETDMVKIMQYNVMSLPAVVVDGVVKCKGKVPSKEEVKEMLGL
jgi:small redox-active disulfide protein 2